MIGLLLIAAASAASAGPVDDIVVRAQLPPHCHARPGDPLDAIKDLPKGWGTLRLKRDGRVAVAQDGLHFEEDTETWQRSGAGMADYIFRVPVDGSPLCMGSRTETSSGGVQLRRALDPRDFRGRHIRFTAFAASRDAKSVSFWVNGGGGEKQFVQVGWGGTHGWTPVSLDVQVSDRHPMAAYGFTLSGGGDVWLYQPHIDIIGSNGKPTVSQPDRR